MRLDLATSEAAFDILLALSYGPSHGYAMIKTIQAHRQGRTMQPGLLYTTLPKLLEAAWIREHASLKDSTDKRRKYYELTADGRAALVAEADRRLVMAQQLRDVVRALP